MIKEKKVNENPIVSIVMGSQSDWKTLIFSEEILTKFKINYEKKIISAHRTPNRLYEYAKSLSDSTTIFLSILLKSKFFSFIFNFNDKLIASNI